MATGELISDWGGFELLIAELHKTGEQWICQPANGRSTGLGFGPVDRFLHCKRNVGEGLSWF
jgi:hypothetical protein